MFFVVFLSRANILVSVFARENEVNYLVIMAVDVEEINGHFTNFLFKTDSFSNCLRSAFFHCFIYISNYISNHFTCF
ncbi:hypothetical protein B0A65_11225 [Flavobacterium frigidimaris]|uniref:Secreted protein n=1 Tax=Flavobacterium frigidimaris TaxID=262320 RepID=A0ABX4BQF1_FLAFR|nr:hypothetical protein B0A65_11225 [Flavobacterium frigidimaris]